MDRIKHTYRAIINDKFTDLISANSTKTWAGMKELLDKKMPEKKKRRWFLWFTTRAGIIAIILFSLFASAAAVYIGTTRNNQENLIAPVVDQKNEIKSGEIKNDQPVVNNNSVEKTNMQSQNIPKPSLQSSVVKNHVTMQSQDMNAGKRKNLAAKEVKNTPTTALEVKDSASVTTLPPQTEVTEKRRAF